MNGKKPPLLFSALLCPSGRPFLAPSGGFGRCGGGRGSPLVRPYGVRLLRSLRGDEGRHSRPLEDARRPPEGDRGFCAAAAARSGLGCKGLVVLLPFSEAVYARQPQGLP